MSHPVKPDMLRLKAELIQLVKQLGHDRKTRAAKLHCTPQYVGLLERGFVPRYLLHFLEAGIITLASDTELAHETDDTKGVDDDNYR